MSRQGLPSSASDHAAMMGVRINLLPWRARQRERRSKLFMVLMVGCVLLGSGIGWGRAAWVTHQLNVEQARLDYIRDGMTALARDIASVQALEARQAQLQGRIRLIRQLEFSRPQTVAIFNALTATLVDGACFDRLVRHGDQLEISALARTNRQVSDQMRSLAGSDIFGEPRLQDVRTADGNTMARRFNLSIPIASGERMTAAATAAKVGSS